MGVGFVRIRCCVAALVLALLVVASFEAATGISDFASGKEAITTKMAAGRKLLGVHLNDYGEPSANRGHDPRGKPAAKPSKKKPKKRSR